MTKYQLNIVATYNHGNGFVEKERETFYSSYPVHLLKKFELYKNELDWNWKLQVSVFKIENILTLTLDEIGSHFHNDKDCDLICKFSDEGVLEP